MRAIVCHEPGTLALEERPEPSPEAGEVLVQIRRVGICGTDFHIFEGKHPFLQYPSVMGHELSAEVLEAPASSGLEPGQPVIVNLYLSCGVCHACGLGQPNCCMRIAVLGVHRDGGMCERPSLPASNLRSAEDLTLDQAASIEFLAIGAHRVRRAGVSAGLRTLVIGVGPIGLGAAIFTSIAGGVVWMMDRDPDRLTAGAGLMRGAGAIIADESALAAVFAARSGNGFDIVIDATGNRASMENGFRYVAHGGTYLLLGVVRDVIAFSDAEFNKREMTLKAGRNAVKTDFDAVRAAIALGKVSEWATRRRRDRASDQQAQKVPSARKIARVMTAARDHLSKADTIVIAAIEAGAPMLLKARDRIARFHVMIRKKTTPDLERWIADANIGLLASFASGIRRDHAAVRAAIAVPWSNGQTEGQITKLKVLDTLSSPTSSAPALAAGLGKYAW